MALLAFNLCFLQPNLPLTASSRNIPSLLKSPSYCKLNLVSTSSSSYSPSLVTEQDDSSVTESSTVSSEDSTFSGCKACGKSEVERGCNGEGRIQGGIATVPGFGWWPIKAFRPCPEFVASGGRYKRRGQSMDEVTSGRGRAVSTADRKKSKSRYDCDTYLFWGCSHNDTAIMHLYNLCQLSYALDKWIFGGLVYLF